jgi:hypothetical protein
MTEIPLTIPTIDPKVLPNATGEMPTEGNLEDTSHEESYTLEDEQEGETLSGTKEMRAEGDDEDEINSKRPKGPFPSNEATK